LEHSIGHQALDLPSPPFSFFLKGTLGPWGFFSFLGHNFQFNLEYLFGKSFLRRNIMISLGEREKERSRMRIL
jgi:hypothetical protein